MIELDANIDRYPFKSHSLAPETFQVASFRGSEEISQVYRFDLNLVSEDPIVDFAQVINRPATFTMRRGLRLIPNPAGSGMIPFFVPVPVHGIISCFEQAGRVGNRVAYRATLVPRLWWLSLNYQTRIFQNASVIDIISEVLDSAVRLPGSDTPKPILYSFDLLSEEAYRPRPYCVQYRESDLDFISRLLEFEGISYFFDPFWNIPIEDRDQAQPEDRVVFTDQQGAFVPIDMKSKLRYHQGAGLVGDEIEAVREFICHERVVPGRVLLKDYNYEAPDLDLQAESQINDTMPGTRYEYGQHFNDVSEGKRLARVRNEEIEARRRVLSGKSDCMGLRSGHRFTLTKHYRPDVSGDYVITRVEHEGSQKRAMGLLGDVTGNGQKSDVLYKNTFRCIPAHVSYRPPRRTPVPQVPGVMTARLEARDPADKYAHLDEEGRYRARMHFDLRVPVEEVHEPDEETLRGEASGPIRMNQPYSGRNYGVHFPNHDGTEMVWSCVNGDPDRPMALGTVPNANTVSPSTSANEPQSVIRTEGGNELTFDDTDDAENIYMHATKDHTVKVNNNESVSVGSVQNISVGNHQITSVNKATWHAEPQKGDQHILAANDQVLLAGNDQFVHAQHNQEVVVDGERNTTVIMGNDTLDLHYGDRTVTLREGTDTLQVDAGDRVVNLAVGNDNRNILSGNRTVTLNAGKDTLTAAGKDAMIERFALDGEYSVEAKYAGMYCAKNITLLVGQTRIEITSGMISLLCGESSIMMLPDEILIDSPQVKINCSQPGP